MVFQPKFLSTSLSTLKHFFIDLIIFDHNNSTCEKCIIFFNVFWLVTITGILQNHIFLTKICYFQLTLFVYYSLLQINVKMDAVPRCSLLNKKRLFSYHFRLKEDWNGKSWGACQKKRSIRLLYNQKNKQKFLFPIF